MPCIRLDKSYPVQPVTVRYDSTGYVPIWRGAGKGDGLSSRLPVQDWNDRETGEPMDRVVRNPFQGKGAGGKVGSHTQGISFQCPCCRTLQIQNVVNVQQRSDSTVARLEYRKINVKVPILSSFIGITTLGYWETALRCC